jgi:proton-translocating NADH-quinone oxidoreductase chain L
MTVATLLAIATLLPLVSFVILVFVGKRMGNPIAGVVGTIFISGSFVCSLAAMIVWLSAGSESNAGSVYGFGGQPVRIDYDWIPVGKWLSNNGFLQVGIYVDSLTIVMFAMITLVASLVHVFSIGYMAGDKRFPRFFTYLGLFCFSMLGLVIGGTILQLFIFWELVGLCSYLLIGFWYEKKTASNAAIKAFVTNRVGDFGFVIGLGILFFNLGNVTLPDVWGAMGRAGKVETGQVLVLPADGTPAELAGTVHPDRPEFTKYNHMSATLLTVMGIGLFFGAVGKSAQFPLHVWLPDAMEGPTPVSALIHAATMVAAGVYLVGRIFPILTPDAKLFIAIIGCTTLTMAALIALAQTDIKKVLAYSTLSQLGYMILALAVGSWVGGLFHLITHAFFKALLFLGSGSVIHAAHHEQELTQYGGLWRKIPYTAATFGVGVLAIAGTPFLSGYYSKDMIIEHAGAFSWLATHTGKPGSYWLFFALPTAIAYVTAFYMTRCWMLTFAGKPRNQHLYDHAHDTPILYIPLIVLAVLSVIGGAWLGVQPLLESSIQETRNYFDPAKARPTGAAPVPTINGRFEGFDTAWQSEHAYKQSGGAAEPPPHAEAFEKGHDLVQTCVFWAFLVGIGLGVAIYWNGFKVANAMLRIPPIRWINIWLYRRMYFDELYLGTFVAITMAFATIAAVIDKYLVDGLVNFAAHFVKRASDFAGLTDAYVVDGAVNGAANVAQDIGAAVRAPQSGRIRAYVLALMVAVTLGLAGAILIVLSRLGF